MHTPSRPSRLLAYTLMLQALEELHPTIEAIERSDRDLGNQIRRAATSVVLNLAESCASTDGNRKARRKNALGSLYEVEAVVAAAVALEYVDAGRCAAVRQELMRITSMVEALVRA